MIKKDTIKCGILIFLLYYNIFSLAHIEKLSNEKNQIMLCNPI